MLCGPDVLTHAWSRKTEFLRWSVGCTIHRIYRPEVLTPFESRRLSRIIQAAYSVGCCHLRPAGIDATWLIQRSAILFVEVKLGVGRRTPEEVALHLVATQLFYQTELIQCLPPPR